MILLKILSLIGEKGLNDQAFQAVYPAVRALLVVCQSAAVMEIFHALFKVVRSPVMTTFLQVFSRIMVLYGSLELGTTDVTNKSWCTQMLVAWALSEIIRYSYYVANLLLEKDKIPSVMTWIRYSGFLVLYPMGISGEIACMYNGLSFVQKNKPYTVELPNWYNFSFSYYNFIWFALLGMYPYGSYVMYSYMLSQRKKTLGDAKKAKSE